MAKLERDIQHALIGIISGLKHAMRLAMQEHKIPLSPLYFLIMKLIHETPHCTPMLIADRSGRDKGQITRLLKELDQHELLIRQQNPADKRSFFIELSDKGLHCFELLEELDMQALEAMTHGLSEQQLEDFLATATQMSQNLERFERAN
ncbi:MarR family winged helix-turn-helix transcriptional regulator [Marinomonas fungiae]|uniref:DNA-binding transcriptional regulator, MarR family n=1 Tax=Marinomonas fungiae TaxID=1137284 RepID=A0A0K6IP65_9GAMM|nr:MarR family transcriptional regulator [Marinomonas fungiae]CUB04891.1 DNA-binding transcriptional regulator, MarR family [Marinomonas fungiae]